MDTNISFKTYYLNLTLPDFTKQSKFLIAKMQYFAPKQLSIVSLVIKRLTAPVLKTYFFSFMCLVASLLYLLVAGLILIALFYICLEEYVICYKRSVVTIGEN